MRKRAAFRAGSFYPARPAACRAALADCLTDVSPTRLRGTVLGGIVPHAGWVYSGPTAAATFRAIGDPPPRTFVLFGAVHVPGVDRAEVAAEDGWETPLGVVPVDGELRDLVLAEAGDGLAAGSAAHRREHSIEVQVPFVGELFPGAMILPIAVPPSTAAIGLGAAVGRVLRALGGRCVVLGSTDLTHYGPGFYGFAPAGVGPEAHRWAKETNDRSFLDRVLALDAEGALRDAREKKNACGAGAVAAAIAAALALGATRAELLAHTTSHEARGDDPEPTDFVGYASVVFLT